MWKIKEMKTQIHMTIMSSLKLYYSKYLKANKYFFCSPGLISQKSVCLNTLLFSPVCRVYIRQW